MSAETFAAPHPVLAAAPWLRAGPTQRVLAALEADGHRARVVGGAVRNALIGRPVADIDMATEAPPDAVLRLAESAGLKAVPTGIAHGTITVIADGTPFEVTTLRRDVETHGRHATVAFTDDWRADAERRDFTMNALYCDAHGVLLDYVGGLADLERARVRFIGDAHARIREDYLRILRFFRFAAEYGEGQIDATGLEACITERAGLARLSAERVRAELLKLLAARHVLYVLDVMQGPGLLAEVLGCEPDMRALRRLRATAGTIRQVERATAFRRRYKPDERAGEIDPLLSLAALAVQNAGDADRLMHRLRLSRSERDRLAGLAMVAASEPAPPQEPHAMPGFLLNLRYRYGDTASEGVRLAWARSSAGVNDPIWGLVVRETACIAMPQLPFSGADVLALGVAPGPRVGEVLRAFEAWWIDAGFPDEPAGNLRRLESFARDEDADTGSTRRNG